MKPIHILIIPSWYQSDYKPMAGNFFREQALSLCNAGHRVGIIHVNQYSAKLVWKHKRLLHGAKEIDDKGLKTYRMDAPRIPGMERLNSKRLARAYRKLISTYIQEHGRPDIVHLHSFSAGEAALWIKQNYGVPYVITEHASSLLRDRLSSHKKSIAQRVFHESSSNMAVSEQFCSFLEKQFNQKFEYVPNFIDTSKFYLSDTKTSAFRFINVGGMKSYKQHSMLLKAFHKAFKNTPNVELIIAGDGPERDSLSALIESYHLQKQVFLVGSLSRDQVIDFLHKSNVFALSSSYETFGVVLIEAMSCGLPVVSTRCGGPESIVTDRRVGLLCDIEEHALSQAMREIYHNEYDSNYIRSFVESNFSEHAVVKRLEGIYEASK